MSDPEDVLDFLNSLPETKNKANAPRSSLETTKSTSKDDEIFEFLDEIAQHELLKPKKKLVPKQKEGTSSTTTIPASIQKAKPKEEKAASAPLPHSSAVKNPYEEQNQSGKKVANQDKGQEEQAEEDLPNPIASISNWWSREGTQKVTNLWGAITSNAERISETTYQIASQTTNQINERSKQIDRDQIEQHVGQLGSRLNGILSSISQQIKQGLELDDVDEVLNVLIVSDIVNLQYLKDIVRENFEAVMDQVQGRIGVGVHEFYKPHGELKVNSDDIGATNVNTDASDGRVSLGTFYGKLIDGEKLALANLENAIREYKKAEITKEKEEKEQEKEEKEEKDEKDEKEEKKTAKNGEKEEDGEEIDDDKEMLKSNIFLAVQPISVGKLVQQRQGEEGKEEAKVVEENASTQDLIIESHNAESFSFTLILNDITNNITITTRTQPFPLRWAQWLDGEKLRNVRNEAVEEEDESVDPKEWVKDWIRQGLNLGVGVLAQEYVIKRMGI